MDRNTQSSFINSTTPTFFLGHGRKVVALAIVAALWTPTESGAHPNEDTPPGESARAELTVEQAVRIAIMHSPRLAAAKGRVGAARGRAIQAGAWSNPELEIAVEEWPVSRGGAFSDAKQTLGVMQTLPFPGKKALEREIGQAGVKLSGFGQAVLRTELTRDVKAAYARVLAAERAEDVTAQLVEVAGSSAKSAGRKTEAGATAYQEQLRAEIQHEQAETKLAEARLELAVARTALATLMGRPELSGAVLSSRLNESPEEAWPAILADDWLSRHPSFKAAQAQVDQAALDSRRARLEPYPDVKLGVAGGRLGETDQSILELRLAVPLPILDTSRGRKAEAQALLTTAQAEQRLVEYQLRQAWVNAQARYNAAADQMTTYQGGLLPKATEAMRLVRIGFDEGKFGFMDLLDTQRTAAEAQLDYLSKLLELNIAQAELQALTHPEPPDTDPFQ